MKHPMLTLLGALVVLTMAANTAYAAPTSEKGPRCSDSIDNDGDGLIDGDDPDCGGTSSPPRLVVVDSTGAVVGAVLTASNFYNVVARAGIEGPLGPASLVLGFTSDSRDVNGTGATGQIWYESSDCSGTPYVRTLPTFTAFTGTAYGFPVTSPAGEKTIYLANGPEDPNFIPGSTFILEFGTNAVICQQEGGRQENDLFYPAEPYGDFYALFPPPYDVIEQ